MKHLFIPETIEYCGATYQVSEISSASLNKGIYIKNGKKVIIK